MFDTLHNESVPGSGSKPGVQLSHACTVPAAVTQQGKGMNQSPQHTRSEITEDYSKLHTTLICVPLRAHAVQSPHIFLALKVVAVFLTRNELVP